MTCCMEGDKLTWRILHNMDSLERIWRVWEVENRLSPFLYFDYVREIYRQTRYHDLKYRPVFACVEGPKGMLMIAPLKWNVFKRNYKLLADTQGCGQTDFLFAPSTDADTLRACVELFAARIGHKVIFRRMNEHSPVTGILRGMGRITKEARLQCVTLSFGEDFDAHLKTLSASVRQNIRTAYNRMKRDDVTCTLQLFTASNRMSSLMYKDVMRLYLERLFLKYTSQRGLKRLWRIGHHTFVYKYWKHDTISLRANPNTFHALLFINGELASFMAGFMDNEQQKLVIPRLAIDHAFKFYSPGYVLLCETMRQLIANTAIRELDLSRGDERYKFDLGGQPYYTDSYVFV